MATGRNLRSTENMRCSAPEVVPFESGQRCRSCHFCWGGVVGEMAGAGALVLVLVPALGLVLYWC